MTVKQRILGALDGKAIDRTPWCPFLAYYWDYLPKQTQDAGQQLYLEQMGADPLLRGFFSIAENEYKNCTIRNVQDGKIRTEIIETPVGKLVSEYRSTDASNSCFLYKHAVETEEDFKTLMYLYEHMEVRGANAKFEKDYGSLGESAVVMPTIGTGGKTAFQMLVEHWCGTQNLTYALADFPELVEECLQVMWEKDKKTVEISVDSSVEALLFYEDSSTTNISPKMFEKYTAPEIKQWADIIHKADKRLVHHACGHIKDLLPLMAGTGVDAIESISPPPTGNIELEDAIKLLPERVALIGGIEPLFFRNCTLEQLEQRVNKLLAAMKGRRFILANSDSCPPDVTYEKFKLVSELVRK